MACTARASGRARRAKRRVTRRRVGRRSPRLRRGAGCRRARRADSCVLGTTTARTAGSRQRVDLLDQQRPARRARFPSQTTTLVIPTGDSVLRRHRLRRAGVGVAIGFCGGDGFCAQACVCLTPDLSPTCSVVKAEKKAPHGGRVRRRRRSESGPPYAAANLCNVVLESGLRPRPARGNRRSQGDVRRPRRDFGLGFGSAACSWIASAGGVRASGARPSCHVQPSAVDLVARAEAPTVCRCPARSWPSNHHPLPSHPQHGAALGVVGIPDSRLLRAAQRAVGGIGAVQRLDDNRLGAGGAPPPRTRCLASCRRAALPMRVQPCSRTTGEPRTRGHRWGRGLYNEVISATNNEQTLQLIVRARYGEPAGLLRRQPVTANLHATASTASQLGSGHRATTRGTSCPSPSASPTRRDRTICLRAVQGERYAKAIVSPVGLDVLVLVFRRNRACAGAARLGSGQEVNGLQNPRCRPTGNASRLGTGHRPAGAARAAGQATWTSTSGRTGGWLVIHDYAASRDVVDERLVRQMGAFSVASLVVIGTSLPAHEPVAQWALPTGRSSTCSRGPCTTS